MGIAIERWLRERDVRGVDLGIGIAVALVVLIGASVALEAARLGHRADVVPIDPGMGIPIAVRPILDVPAKGDGGAGGPAVVPRSWARAPVASRSDSGGGAVEPDASVSPAPVPVATTPGAPRTTRRRSRSGLPSLDGRPDASDVEPPAETAGPVAGEGDGGGPATGAGDEGSGGAGGAGGDGAAGDPDGEDDGAGARAVALYRDRLTRWLSAHFAVTGSGLSREALRRQRVRAVVRVDAEGIVTDFDVIPSGNAAFDEGARRALEAVRGEPVPTPPQDYPGALQREIHVTFVCRESRCD